jgi:hypothetical protein
MGKSRQKIVVKSEERRLVYGEVYAPMQIDTDGEAMTAAEIEKMAHSFLVKGNVNKIDVQHNYTESGCCIVESFIARKNDPDGFLEGSWVLGVKVGPDEIWNAVKKGELNGFSFAGGVNAKRVYATVTVARRIVGKVEKSDPGGLLPPHGHEVDVEFDADGNVISGSTSMDFGHEHPVLRTTATEKAMEHSHRMILIENDN